jgi:sulfur relay (sulfurtransferase) DsrC/TusE family protein
MALIGFLFWAIIAYIIEYHWKSIIKFFTSFTDKKEQYKAKKQLEKNLDQKVTTKKINPPEKIDWFPSSPKR